MVMTDSLDDPVRREIDDRLAGSGFNMKSLSIEIGRGDTYVRDFLKKGVPATLPLEVAEEIAKALGVEKKRLDHRYWQDPAAYDRQARVEAESLSRDPRSETLDSRLLRSCAEGFEKALERLGLEAVAENRAKALSLLYEYHRTTRVPLDDEIFNLMAKALARSDSG